MKKLLSLVCVVFIFFTAAIAQPQATVQEGEVGITLGMAHYFGDLNNRAAINRPKPAFGIFYRKQFGDYVGVRLGGHFAQVYCCSDLQCPAVEENVLYRSGMRRGHN